MIVLIMPSPRTAQRMPTIQAAPRAIRDPNPSAGDMIAR